MKKGLALILFFSLVVLSILLSSSSFIIAQSNSTTSKCTDTDGGINYGVKGTVNQTNSSGSFIFVDSCTTSTALKEYYCSSNKSYSSSYSCPYGCLNGACKSASSSQTNSTNGSNSTNSTIAAGGRILRVSKIVNSSSTSPNDDKVYLIDINSGQTFFTAFIKEGQGTITIGGRIYNINYSGGNSIPESNRYIIIWSSFTSPSEEVITLQSVFFNNHVIMGNPNWPYRILKVKEIVNSSSSTPNDDRVKLEDIKTLETFSASMISEGIGTFTIDGKVYPMNYFGSPSSLAQYRYIVIKDYLNSTMSQKVFWNSHIVFFINNRLALPHMCGDNVVQSPEVCDGSHRSCSVNGILGIQSCSSTCLGYNICRTNSTEGNSTALTCQSFGYQNGTLGAKCANSTNYDLSRCYNQSLSCNDLYGVTYLKKDNVTFSQSISYGPSCSGGVGSGGGGTLADKCANSVVLQEAICNPNKTQGFLNYTCPTGCLNGSCLESIFFEPCSSLQNWTLNPQSLGWGILTALNACEARGLNPGIMSAGVEMISQPINLQGRASALLRFNYSTAGLDAGEYFKVFLRSNSSSQWVQVYNATYTNTNKVGKVVMSNFIPLTSGVQIKGYCNNNAGSEYCRWDNIEVVTP